MDNSNKEKLVENLETEIKEMGQTLNKIFQRLKDLKQDKKISSLVTSEMIENNGRGRLVDTSSKIDRMIYGIKIMNL